MATVTVHAGVCGHTTTITAESDDGQNVRLTFDSTCPHVMAARESLRTVDAFQELFRKPAETKIYAALAEHLPHAACPLYSAFFKAVEVAAGLALPQDAVMEIAG